MLKSAILVSAICIAHFQTAFMIYFLLFEVSFYIKLAIRMLKNALRRELLVSFEPNININVYEKRVGQDA